MKRLAALVVLIALAAPLRGQERPSPPPAPAPSKPAQKTQEVPISPVSESVDVSVTNVDVFVTDSKGQRVSGLKADDFEVHQDGIPIIALP